MMDRLQLALTMHRQFGRQFTHTRNTKDGTLHVEPATKFAQLYSQTKINACKLCARMIYTRQYLTECAVVNPGDQPVP